MSYTSGVEWLKNSRSYTMTGYREYTRWCKRCGNLFKTVCKSGRVCKDCNKRNIKEREMLERLDEK